MGYIQSTLLKDEKCFYMVRPHWIVYAMSVVLLVCSFLVYSNTIPMFSGFGFGHYSLREILALLLFIVAVYQGVIAWILQTTSEYGITNKRILMKKGLIQRDTVELFLDKIEAVHIVQSVLGRMLGYGTLVVVGTGGTRDPFVYLPSPLEFRKKVQQQIDLYTHPKR